MPRKRTLALLVLALVGVVGLWLQRPATRKAKPAVRLDLGPYPFDLVAPVPRDQEWAWSDPEATARRAADENAKVPRLKAALHKEHKGDGGKAIEALLPKSKEPDSAQALLEIMNAIVPMKTAPQPSEAKAGPGSAKPTADPVNSGPVFRADGASGLHAIAKVAETLKARYATKEMGHFDPILLERAILLLGFHGAPDLPGAAKAKQADGKEVPAIDPVTRATLRGLLQLEGAPQILAARALGQLGDLQTAREIIEQPGKYPGASIADYGPKAVDEFKQARLKQLKQGVEGFDNMVQGMRLTPKYQDVAIELAEAGDAGAGMAMMRNFVLEQAQLGTDEVLARRIDTVLRFPGTRAAKVAKMAINFDYFDASSPKSMAMILKAMDHDLKIVFHTKNWNNDQLCILDRSGSSIFSYLWHVLEAAGDTPMGKAWRPLYQVLETLFRKYYRKEIFPSKTAQQGAYGFGPLLGYAIHLKLPALNWENKIKMTTYLWQTELEMQRGRDPLDRDNRYGNYMGTPPTWVCYRLGHYKGPEVF